VVAVVGFPRREDVEAARQAGVRAVVSKPFLAGDLLWQLDRAADEQQRVKPAPPATQAGR
jgi:AmiR/NasT family two-component response regulator